MLKNIYDTFINLDCLEKVLLITLIISLLCKGVVEIICWVTCKNFNKDKSHIKPCIYLKRGKKQDCNLQEFKHKHFLSEECNKQMGYSWLYDYFFSLGGPIERLIFKFKHENTNYVIWCWKGDYWNLGAGSEIGIYYTDNDKYAENNFYLIDESLTVHTRMIVKYRWLFGSEIGSSTLIDFHQTNWWVTMFTPAVQHPRVDRIDVDLYVRFTGDNYYSLMESFYNTYKDKDDNGEWAEISILPWSNKAKPLGHESHEVCGLNPAVCNCVCPTYNTNCAGPCTYYTYKCQPTDAESGCLHYNDSDM